MFLFFRRIQSLHGNSYRRSQLCILKLAKVYDSRESVQMVTGNKGSDISLKKHVCTFQNAPKCSEKIQEGSLDIYNCVPTLYVLLRDDVLMQWTRKQ
jgi:hypothetical protein